MLKINQYKMNNNGETVVSNDTELNDRLCYDGVNEATIMLNNGKFKNSIMRVCSLPGTNHD